MFLALLVVCGVHMGKIFSLPASSLWQYFVGYVLLNLGMILMAASQNQSNAIQNERRSSQGRVLWIVGGERGREDHHV